MEAAFAPMEKSSTNAKEVDKRKQFGNRFLTDTKNVFEHNAWDNVVWDETQEKEAKRKTEEQLAFPVSVEEKEQIEEEANKNWNKFYEIHENRFFKDRHWLFTEFNELSPESYLSKEHLLELGKSKGINRITNKVSSEDSLGTDEVKDKISSEGSLDTDAVKYKVSNEDSLDTDTDNTSSEHSTIVKFTDAYVSSNGYMHKNPCMEVNDTANCEESEYRHILNGTQALCVNELVPNSEKLSFKYDSVSTLNDHAVTDGAEEVTEVEQFIGESAKYRIFEVGCGVGNTVFPILQINNDPKLMVYCCDFSSTAIGLVKVNQDYDDKRCHAFVCDITDPESKVPFPNGSLDVIILIFVLSAIAPEKSLAVINRLAAFLKPGGVLLFRDYGRYDLAQLRFKKGRCLGENFYARGDGTRVYFFTQDEIRTMMTNAGLLEKQNLVDRRLQVNRGRQLKMYRVWIQCKYVKPILGYSASS